MVTEIPSDKVRVYHGTCAETPNIKAGILGHPGYTNISLDPLSALAYANTGNHTRRLTIWETEPQDVKSVKSYCPDLTITRAITPAEKKAIIAANVEQYKIQPVPRYSLKNSSDDLAEKSGFNHGLSASQLCMVIDEPEDTYLGQCHVVHDVVAQVFTFAPFEKATLLNSVAQLRESPPVNLLYLKTDTPKSDLANMTTDLTRESIRIKLSKLASACARDELYVKQAIAPNYTNKNTVNAIEISPTTIGLLYERALALLQLFT